MGHFAFSAARVLSPARQMTGTGVLDQPRILLGEPVHQNVTKTATASGSVGRC